MIFLTFERHSNATCKRTQHYCPTTPNSVGYYMLRPFAHLLHVVAGYWELLSPSLKLVFANGRNIVGQQLPTLLDVTCCVCLHTRCVLLGVVVWSLKLVFANGCNTVGQQLAAISLLWHILRKILLSVTPGLKWTISFNIRPPSPSWVQMEFFGISYRNWGFLWE